ncbi:ankyrin repeat domain-containing protein [Legionella impletisoli]|uniref:Ankyrin repeats (3 copies) n=1 Tax=Legionella impletisoli TaxID=343510 RepID=A0A917N947_9GAMM|nr:ankyrin repeat domain-containing protein [Legionella impletisoli]GGI79437.1 hypothetical protein GCM10007966_04930 [Legionella impletisoli]
MLFDLFSWIHCDGDVNVLKAKPIAIAHIQQALSEAIVLQQSLLSSMRALHFSPASSEQERAKAKSAFETNVAYQQFLSTCNHHVDTLALIEVSQLALTYLSTLEDKPLRLVKTQALFHFCFSEDQTRALSIFQTNYNQLDDEVRVDVFLLKLATQLRHQAHPLGITSLLADFVEDTIQFTAAILWLLKRGVAPQAILSSGLMHHFFAYHIAYLDSDESPLKRFYHLLASYPEAEELIGLARRTTARMRGFEEFSLTGDRTAESLLKEEVCTSSIRFSISRNNAFALYNLFHTSFLLEALDEAHANKESWRIILKELLNHEDTHDVLSNLLDRLVRNGHYLRLKRVGELLEDSTGARLLEKDVGGIFHLLPFKPSWYEQVSLFNITNYLKRLKETSYSTEDVIAQLVSIIKGLQKTHQSSANEAYQALVNLIALNPDYLNDALLLNMLRRYPGKDGVLQEIVHHLSLQFEESFAEILTQDAFGEEQFYTLEDTWKSISKQLSVLSLIGTVSSPVPHDKYELFTYVAQGRLAHLSEKMNYKALACALRLEPELSRDWVNEYERYVIELLIALDHEPTRTQIVSELNCKYGACATWIGHKYGGRTLLSAAAEQGNSGLLRWLLSGERRLTLQTKELTAALLRLAQLGHWQGVEVILEVCPEILDKKIEKRLLFLAAEQDQLVMVHQLIELGKFTDNVLQSALVKAVEAGHSKVAHYLLNEEIRPPRAVSFAKGFRKAFLAGSWLDAQFFASYKTSPSVRHEVHQLLIHSVLHQDKAGIECLCDLECNEPDQHDIEQAFEEAAKMGEVELLELFCNSTYQPTLPSIERALNRATKNGHEEAVRFICESPKIRPTKAAIGTAFILAAGAGYLAIIRYLYTYEVKPSRSAIYQALNQAKANQHHEMATFLKNPRHFEAHQRIELESPLSIVGFFACRRSQQPRDGLSPVQREIIPSSS